MSAEFDRTLYQQIGELIAEVRGLRTSIDAAQSQNVERFTRIEDRVKVVEDKVDQFEGILDRVRGATSLAKFAQFAGGAASGGAIATLVSALVGG